ncbi:thrombospondin type 3 repeat-containing protein [Myxococcota bacterium]|nr:thrombospondin type 3 repeat-containing protein [Myxococcota bacterium]
MKNIFLSFLVLAFASPVFAADLYIDDDHASSNDTGNCLLDTTPCKTLEYALTQAATGDTIYVESGTYDSTAATFPLMVGEGVNILGAGSEVTNLVASTTQALLKYLDNQGTSTLSGLAIRNAGGNAVMVEQSSSADLSLYMDDVWLTQNNNNGLRVSGAGALRLELINSRIDSNSSDGLYLKTVDGLSLALFLENNVISDNSSQGLYIDNSYMDAVIDIQNNTIERNAQQNIYIFNYESFMDVLIQNNLINDASGQGVYFSNSSATMKADVIGNEMMGNSQTGFYFSSEFNSVDGGATLLIQDNILENNGASGAYLEGQSARLVANVEGNLIRGNNDYGIYAIADGVSSVDLTIENNTISDNSNNAFHLNVTANSANIQLAMGANLIEENSGSGVFLVANGSNNLLNATLENNTIRANNDGVYLENKSVANQVGVDLLNNTISDNRDDGIEITAYSGMLVDMRGNVIADNVDNGVYVNSASYGFSLNLQANTFRGNDAYAIYNSDNDTPILALENWWGTTSPTAIAAMVYDNEDALNGRSYIIFDDPLDTTLLFEPMRTEAPEEGGASVLIMALEGAPPFVASAGINKLVVMFGEVEALAVEVVANGRAIYAVAPPHAPGVVDITVTNPGAQSGVARGSFEYLHTLYDMDNDGILDDVDNCLDVPNTDQANADSDAMGNACDDDDDDDTVLDAADNCPLVANLDQADMDSDGTGDACDGDVDGDTVLDAADNCPMIANAAQVNTDGDAVGNECDEDDDNDGVPDAQDVCPFVLNLDQSDMDGDGLGDACDTDADGNGTLDEVDVVQGAVESATPTVYVQEQSCASVRTNSSYGLFGVAFALFVLRRRRKS